VGLARIELATSSLSGTRSNRLSYSPAQAKQRSSGPRSPRSAKRARSIHSRVVKVFKRLLLVLGAAGAVGMLARLRGKGGVPPTSGGWRELEGPEFR
jgi:hypothetical protein